MIKNTHNTTDHNTTDNKIVTTRGNLFDSSMQTLTNTVNTAGVMGAGIAKAFKFLKITRKNVSEKE